MSGDLLPRARETVCGWDRCPDCQILRETIAEIEQAREQIEDLARLLSSSLVFVHESIVDEVDRVLSPHLGSDHTGPERPLNGVLTASEDPEEGMDQTIGMSLNLAAREIPVLRDALRAFWDGQDRQIGALVSSFEVLDAHASRASYPADLSIRFHKEHP